MPRTLAHFRRFVRRLHRRLVFLRAAEGSGIGLLCGAGTALVLTAAQAMRKQDSMPLVMLAVVAGTLGGLAWAILRRPAPIDAAAEADRQLDLADLLSTAHAIAARPDSSRDAFEEAVLAMADHRCASLSPDSVILHRLGLRAWSGIGLATALSLVMGLLVSHPADAPAAVKPRIAAGASLRTVTSPTDLRSSRAGAYTSRIAVDFPGGQDNGFNPARDTVTDHMKAGDGSSKVTDHGNPEGAGTGSGTSSVASRAEHLRPDAPGSAGGNGPGAGASGAGSGNSIASGQGDQRAGGVNSAGISLGGPAAPWSSPSWEFSRQRADQAIRTAQVSAEYHDLIRAYFQRQ